MRETEYGNIFFEYQANVERPAKQTPVYFPIFGLATAGQVHTIWEDGGFQSKTKVKEVSL